MSHLPATASRSEPSSAPADSARPSLGGKHLRLPVDDSLMYDDDDEEEGEEEAADDEEEEKGPRDEDADEEEEAKDERPSVGGKGPRHHLGGKGYGGKGLVGAGKRPPEPDNEPMHYSSSDSDSDSAPPPSSASPARWTTAQMGLYSQRMSTESSRAAAAASCNHHRSTWMARAVIMNDDEAVVAELARHDAAVLRDDYVHIAVYDTTQKRHNAEPYVHNGMILHDRHNNLHFSVRSATPKTKTGSRAPLNAAGDAPDWARTKVTIMMTAEGCVLDATGRVREDPTGRMLLLGEATRVSVVMGENGKVYRISADDGNTMLQHNSYVSSRITKAMHQNNLTHPESDADGATSSSALCGGVMHFLLPYATFFKMRGSDEFLKRVKSGRDEARSRPAKRRAPSPAAPASPRHASPEPPAVVQSIALIGQLRVPDVHAVMEPIIRRILAQCDAECRRRALAERRRVSCVFVEWCKQQLDPYSRAARTPNAAAALSDAFEQRSHEARHMLGHNAGDTSAHIAAALYAMTTANGVAMLQKQYEAYLLEESPLPL